MWRYVLNVTKRVFPKLVNDTTVVTESSLKRSGSVESNSATLSSSNITDSKQVAHAALREAIRELSLGSSKSISLPPSTELEAWNSKQFSDLETEKLELLARAYFEGKSDMFTQNLPKAVELWGEASARGSVEATYSLAVCLRDGVGVNRNANEAITMLLKLADEKNYNLAHFAAAVMLSNGDGIPQNDVEALKHFKAAAKGGIMPALYNIGNFYAAGRGGVKPNDNNAMLYYDAAVQAGDPSAKFTLGCWLYSGRGGKGVDKVRSFQLQFEAAEAGHPAAMFNVGAAYMSGDGVVADVTRAAEWFEKASTKVPQAAINLSNMYRSGVGVQKDIQKARQILAAYADKDETCKALLEELNKNTESDVVLLPPQKSP